MEVNIDKQYPVAAGLDCAWQVLSDVTALATCMPGAQITEQVDATHYKGSVKVKVGPAVAAFAGDIELLAIDGGPHADPAGQGRGQKRLVGVDAAGGVAGSGRGRQRHPGRQGGRHRQRQVCAVRRPHDGLGVRRDPGAVRRDLFAKSASAARGG
ncbi:SRPBCC domain-containing protein [Roseateles sp. GG27B]